MSLSPADQYILDRRIRGLINPDLIDEHRRQPLGPHSAALTEVLHFLRRSPDPDLPRYAVLRSRARSDWAIGIRPSGRGALPRPLDSHRFSVRAEVEHAVFLRRLDDYGIGPSTDHAQGPSAVMVREKESTVPDITGYVDRLSVAPGESISLHVSSDEQRWSAQLVRLLCAELRPEGPALRETEVPSAQSIERDGMRQHTAVGSYVRADISRNGTDLAAGFSCRAFIMPTLPGDGVQAFMSQRSEARDSGWSLRLNERGAVSFWLGGAHDAVTLDLTEPLVRGCWYLVVAAIDAAAMVIELACRPVGTRAANRVWLGRGTEQRSSSELTTGPQWLPGAPLLLACGWLDEHGQPHERFDGRLELPMLLAGAMPLERLLSLEDASSKETVEALRPLAAWDFSAGIGPRGVRKTRQVEDIGPNRWHGCCVNHPTRAVTSHTWDSNQMDFRTAPQEYSAAHFHRDDMTDCAWIPQAKIAIPADLPSGVYAFRLQAIGGDNSKVDRIPFVVRPARQKASSPLLLVLPTNSYLAYANDHVAIDSPRVQMMVHRVLGFDEFDLFRHEHRELGASMYEAHPDGTGICYSSARRPILTMRPQVETFSARAWQFPADLQIVDWLDKSKRMVDVVTDLDVHREGADLLKRYRCVMTGTHPEYVTRQMLDAFGTYLDGGGRLVYIGGNGLYWVTAYDPDDDQVIEIRRWGGSEAWRARPGEHHISFTGEPGGLWRNRNRAPQKTVGVGFVAAGLVDAGAVYARCIDRDSHAGWVLNGVAPDEFGSRGTSGPAAGLEVDAADAELGTPAAAIVIATSAGRHSDDMLEARENYGMTLAAPGGARNPRVRADLLLIPGPNGGGVFSTGSIAWAGALAHDGNISQILTNVLERFCSTQALLD
jgi:N,N-dimethylformamidase